MKTVHAAANICNAFDGELQGRLGRTLWHSLYDQQAGTVEFSFYLGDAIDTAGRIHERRTEYLRFTLEQAQAAASASRSASTQVAVGS